MNQIPKILQCTIIRFLFLSHFYSDCFTQSNIILNFNHITEKDGLNNLINQCINKDEFGRIWITSWDGLFCFNGVNLTNYKSKGFHEDKMSNSRVTGLVNDKNGNLWFGTESLCKYNILQNKFTSHFATSIGSQHLKDYIIPFYCDNNNNIWSFVGKFGTICSFDPICKEFTPIPLQIAYDGIKVLKPNFLQMDTAWTFIDDKILSRIILSKNKKWEQEIFFDGKYHGIKLNKITDIEKINNLIYITCKEGLVELDESTKEYKIYNTFLDKTVSDLTCLEKYQNNLFAGTLYKGIYSFDLKNKSYTKQWTHQSDLSQSLHSNDVLAMYIDTIDGTMWLSLLNKGIDYCKIIQNNFRNTESIKEQLVWTSEIIEDMENNLWYTTYSQGLYLYSPRENKITKSNLNIIDNPSTSLNFGNEDKILIHNSNKIFEYHQISKKIKEIKINNTEYDKDNNFIISKYLNNGEHYLQTEKKLYKILKTTNINYLKEIIIEKPVTLGYPSFIYEFDNGNLIITNNEDGALKIINDTLKFAGEFNKFTGNIIDILQYSTNSFLMINREHVYELQYPDLYVKKANIKFDTDDTKIQCMEIDKKNNIWLATNQGLYKTDLKGKIQKFTTADGLPSHQFSDRASTLTKDGHLVFGTNKGLIYFHLDSLQNQSCSPKLYIDKIMINEKELIDSGNVNYLNFIQLPFQLNSVGIKPITINYLDPTKNLIKYILKPYENNWTEIGNNEMIRYPRLPPGNYSLSIIGSDVTRKYSTEQKMIQIKILAPWYQTIWFKILMTIIGVIIIWWLFQIQNQKLLAKQKLELEKQQILERERARISRDMHDDLGSGLSALHLMTNYLNENYNNSNGEWKDDLSKISTIAKHLNQSIKEIIWSNNIKDDTLYSLLHFIKKYINALSEQSNTEFIFQSVEIETEVILNSEKRKNIFLSVKEALNNALKYSGSTKIIVSHSQISSNEFSIKVQDFGKGMDFGINKNLLGNGLLNMQSRMNLIGGDCIIESSKEGTSIIFILKN